MKMKNGGGSGLAMDVDGNYSGIPVPSVKTAVNALLLSNQIINDQEGRGRP